MGIRIRGGYGYGNFETLTAVMAAAGSLNARLEALHAELSALGGDGGGAARVCGATVVVRVAPVAVAAAVGAAAAAAGGGGGAAGAARTDELAGVLDVSEQCVTVQPARGGGRGGGGGGAQRYDVTLALPSDAVELDIAAAVGGPSLDALCAGFDAAVVSFGKSGLGKSACVMGGGGDAPGSASGLLPRMLADLYDRAALAPAGCMTVRGARDVL